MKVLLENFPTLEKPKSFVSTNNSASVKKSIVVPMKILFKDEKYIDENIQILQQYIEDGNHARTSGDKTLDGRRTKCYTTAAMSNKVPGTCMLAVSIFRQ